MVKHLGHDPRTYGLKVRYSNQLELVLLYWLWRLGFAPKIEDYEPTVILLHYPALIRSATNKLEHYMLKSSVSIPFTMGHQVALS